MDEVKNNFKKMVDSIIKDYDSISADKYEILEEIAGALYNVSKGLHTLKSIEEEMFSEEPEEDDEEDKPKSYY